MIDKSSLPYVEYWPAAQLHLVITLIITGVKCS